MKIFKKIHLWLSVPFGIIICILCLTGTIMLFKTEIEEISHPGLYRAESEGKEALPIDSLAQILKGTYGEGIRITAVNLSDSEDRAYQFRLSIPDQKAKAVYVDPYTGKINGEYVSSEFFRTVRQLHGRLLDERPKDKDAIFWGKEIIGLSTLVFVFILISGIIIWWPKKLKKLGKHLAIHFRKGPRRFLYDLHVSAGFYFTLILLACSITGLVWSYDWFGDSFYRIFAHDEYVAAVEKKEAAAEKRKQQATAKPERGKKNATAAARPAAPGKRATASYESWDLARRNVEERIDGFQSMTISAGSVIVKESDWGNASAKDTYLFDRKTGEIKSAKYYKDNDAYQKAKGWVYTLHTGSWGGLFSKILTGLAVLVGATLPLTGYYIWIRRMMDKSEKKRKKNH